MGEKAAEGTENKYDSIINNCDWPHCVGEWYASCVSM